MLKQNLLKTTALLFVLLSLILLTACGSTSGNDNSSQNPTQTNTENHTTSSEKSSSDVKTESNVTSASVTSAENADTLHEVIAKFDGAADEVGIYSTAITLSNKAADKGVVEMVYYGPKGSPQENSIVNTFRIEYYKEASGTFEINTYYDGEVYQNYHHKDKVKVGNTFSAAVRARNVIVSYTPDGGKTQEIYKADAEQFMASAN